MAISRFSRLFLALLLLGAVSQPVPAQELGPVAVRNQLPFDQLFLGLTPEGASTIGRGALQATLALSWSNTFIMSPEIHGWVAENRAPGRRELTPDEIDRIAAAYPGHDLYFFDGEMARWGLRLAYGLTDTLQLTLDTSVHSRGGGFADHTIESFHNALDLGNANRELFPQNRFQVFMRFGDRQFFRDGAPANNVLGDTSVELKLRSRGRWHGWQGAAAAAIKGPTGNVRNFGGSGEWDAQVVGYASRATGSASALHLDLAYTWLGGIDNLPGFEVSHIWTAMAAWEIWSPHRKLNWVFQGTFTTSVFSGATISDLSDASWLLMAGLRVPVDARDLLTFAFIENIVQYDNSTDVALHISYRHTFGGKDPYP
ncbi:MAG: DUF3187 family protein [Acidobacteria bacterium]|nr:DUF3187 family protein [Acidobacteriota bacterium]